MLSYNNSIMILKVYKSLVEIIILMMAYSINMAFKKIFIDPTYTFSQKKYIYNFSIYSTIHFGLLFRFYE